MGTVSASEAKTHLARLLDRVAGGETVTITRRGSSVARLVPVEDDEINRSRLASRRIFERRKQLNRAPLSESLETVHEGHRF